MGRNCCGGHMKNEQKKPDTLILGVIHFFNPQSGESTEKFVRSLQAFDSAYNSLKGRGLDPVAGIEVSPGEFRAMQQVIEKPGLLSKQPHSALANEGGLFWINFIGQAAVLHPDAKFMPMDSLPAKKYAFAVGRPKEFKEMALTPLRENIAHK